MGAAESTGMLLRPPTFKTVVGDMPPRRNDPTPLNLQQRHWIAQGSFHFGLCSASSAPGCAAVTHTAARRVPPGPLFANTPDLESSTISCAPARRGHPIALR